MYLLNDMIHLMIFYCIVNRKLELNRHEHHLLLLMYSFLNKLSFLRFLCDLLELILSQMYSHQLYLLFYFHHHKLFRFYLTILNHKCNSYECWILEYIWLNFLVINLLFCHLPLINSNFGWVLNIFIFPFSSAIATR